MLTSREIASLIILLGLAVWVVVYPPTRREIPAVVRAVLHPRLAVLWLAYLAYSAAALALMARIGLWDVDILKDTLITVFGVGLPMLMAANDAESGQDLVRDTVKRTLGASALVAAYVNLGTFSVPVEVVIQAIAIPLVMAQVVAEQRPSGRAVRRLVTGLLVTLGAAYLWRTTTYLLAQWRSEDWGTVIRAFGMSVWFPILLIPFVYVVAFAMGTGVVLKMLPFFNNRTAPPLRVRIALVLGLRLSVRYVSSFNGTWRSRIATQTRFRSARNVMAAYRGSVRHPSRGLSGSARPSLADQ